ncbi:nuclear pore complex subunit [Vanrija albida]|uniref:Nuclear pore protein n=1 Tax=Vanrija albida TaxID=181172 RepID=A0ABR3PZU7_9TREE
MYGTAYNNSTSGRPPANSTLTSLLARANSLNAVDHDPELPQIRLGIDELERMSEVAAGRGKRGLNGEGYQLLSNLGINTSQLSHEIAQLPADAAASTSRPARRRKTQASSSRLAPIGDLGPAYAVGDADVGAWGRNWHEMVILSGIEVQRQKTVKSFQKQFQQKILSNWESEKTRVLQDELGVTDDELARLSSGAAGPSRLGESTATALSKSRLGASTRRFPLAESMLGKSTVEAREGGLVMHNKAMQYEKVVSTLNQKRLRKEPYELCQALEATVKNDNKYPLLPKAYNILAHLTQEPSLRDATGSYTSSAAPVLERQYAQAYYADHSSNQHSLLAGRLALGARQSLEHDFELYIDDKIAKNPKEAALGGVPGITNKVRAFVDVTLRSKEAQDAYRPETVGGIKLWAHIYYLLRSGYPEEALQLVEANHNSVKKDDWSFTGSFKAYLQSPDRRLPKNLRDQLYNDFNGHIRNNANVDQFKYALYKLVGRFELARRNAKVAATTEDWVWFQLNLTRENKDGDAPQEQYDLADLAKIVLKYGSEKFDDNGRRPFAWFNLLLYTAQFECAVAYLYSKKELKTDAVHIAIALQYYGLLRVPATTTDAEILTTDDGSGTDYLNFGRLIELYIAPFHRIEPQTALQYAYLVALASDAPAPTGENQRQLALALVRDIVITSRSWSKLLGSVRADGSKETGVIERDLDLLHLADDQDYLQSVVLAAADQASADASLADSVELYHLAGAYDKVVEAVNRALGHSLGQASGAPFTAAQTPASVGLSGAFGGATDLESLSSRVHDVYAHDFSKRSRISQRNWDTLEVLLKLKLALSQFAADRPDLALETFRSTGLLPLDNDTTQIARYAQRFREILDQPVVSNLDDVIITTMKCLHRLSQQLKDSPYGDHGRMQQLSAYKHQAQCLIQFASTLRLRLGPDVYRQLSSMSAFF